VRGQGPFDPSVAFTLQIVPRFSHLRTVNTAPRPLGRPWGFRRAQFKVVRTHGGDEVLARASNLLAGQR
jgi:hypothetical protein